MEIKDINQLQEACELYDITFETRENAYVEEMQNALIALENAAPEQFRTYMQILNLQHEFRTQSDNDLAELENAIKAYVKSLGRTWKARLHQWVFSKGRDKLRFDEIIGYIKAHHDDPSNYIEPGEASVTKRRVKEDKKKEY